MILWFDPKTSCAESCPSPSTSPSAVLCHLPYPQICSLPHAPNTFYTSFRVLIWHNFCSTLLYTLYYREHNFTNSNMDLGKLKLVIKTAKHRSKVKSHWFIVQPQPHPSSIITSGNSWDVGSSILMDRYSVLCKWYSLFMLLIQSRLLDELTCLKSLLRQVFYTHSWNAVLYNSCWVFTPSKQGFPLSVVDIMAIFWQFRRIITKYNWITSRTYTRPHFSVGNSCHCCLSVCMLCFLTMH